MTFDSKINVGHCVPYMFDRIVACCMIQGGRSGQHTSVAAKSAAAAIGATADSRNDCPPPLPLPSLPSPPPLPPLLPLPDLR